MALAEDVLARKRRAIARSISLVENDDPAAPALIEALHGRSGQAFVIGVTGPPGAGKSTLVAAMVKELRLRGRRVGVIAVDPSSPYSGGALLGDRVRMDRVAMDEEVFIRSMSSRGSLGGLSRKTVDAIIVLEAAGFDPILVETVGVGQSEVEIASTADTTLVVLSPEAGDGIQAMKAGLMEIADVFCVNKSDREGADRLVREILNAGTLSSHHGPETWFPTVFKAEARRGLGVGELLDGVWVHREHLESRGALHGKRAASARRRLANIASELLIQFLEKHHSSLLDELAGQIASRRLTPYKAATEVLERFRSGAGDRPQVIARP